MESLDIQLLERWIASRDAEAFTEIVRRYSSMVYGTCRRILGNGNDAEDVAQECFLELALTGGQVRSSLGAWLHAASVHRSLDRLKTDRRRQQREAAFASTPTTDGNGSEAVHWSDVAPHVDIALAQLPEATRELVVLRYLQGMSLENIARDRGLPRSTVQYRLQKAVELVRKKLARQGIPVTSSGLYAGLADIGRQSVPIALTQSLGKMAVAGLDKVAVGSLSAAPKMAALGGLVMGWKGATGVIAGIVLLGAVCLYAASGIWNDQSGAHSRQDSIHATSTVSSPTGGAVQQEGTESNSTTHGGSIAGNEARQSTAPDGSGDSDLNRLFSAAVAGLLGKHGPGTSGRPAITSREIPVDNGAHFFLLAAELFPKEEMNFHGQLEFLQAALKEFREKGTISDPARLQAILDACSGSIEAICKGVETGNAQIPTPQVDDELPYLARFRELTRVMAMQGLLQNASGDPEGALNTFETALAFSNMSVQGGSFINGLVGYAMDQITLDAIADTFASGSMTEDAYRRILVDLQNHEAGAVPIAEHCTVESQSVISFLSDQLADVGKLRQTLLEQSLALGIPTQTILDLSDETLSAYAQGVLTDYARISDYFELSPHEALSTDRSNYYDPQNPLSDLVLTPLFEIQSTVARNQAEIRGTAIIAALEMYRTDHGIYPPSLDALAPGYFAQVPVDPFTEESFAYTANAGEYMLYSAGRDMAYNDGTVDDYKKPGGDLVLHTVP